MKDSTTIIITIIFLVVGLYLGWHIKPNYTSFSHQLNETNPLILDKDFALCNHERYNWYFMVSNLSQINISDNDICDEDYYDGYYNNTLITSIVRVTTILDITKFFGGEEKIIETNTSTYSLLKKRTEKVGVIIEVTDIGKGKQIGWWD